MTSSFSLEYHIFNVWIFLNISKKSQDFIFLFQTRLFCTATFSSNFFSCFHFFNTEIAFIFTSFIMINFSEVYNFWNILKLHHRFIKWNKLYIHSYVLMQFWLFIWSICFWKLAIPSCSVTNLKKWRNLFPPRQYKKVGSI